jgi:hypothetical protein
MGINMAIGVLGFPIVSVLAAALGQPYLAWLCMVIAFVLLALIAMGRYHP